MNKTPYSSEAERSLLGAILIDNSILDDIEIVPSDFYDKRNEHIANAIVDLRSKDIAVDQVTLMDQLKASGHNVDALYIMDLSRSVPTSVHADSYFDIIDRMAVVRGLVKAGTDIVSTAYANVDDPEKAIDESEKILFSLSNRRRQVRWSSASDLMNMTKGRVKSIVIDGIKQGVRSGIGQIDAITGGWQKSDLVILAARPSVGKTALATSMALSAAVSGKKVAIFSIEMSAEQVGSRLLSSASGIPLAAIRNGGIDLVQLSELEQWADTLSKLNIYVDDSPSATPSVVRSKCRKIVAERGVDLIIVDYLQLMSPDRGSKDANRVNEVADISRALKALARELDVPVIALSQLSRMSEYRDSGEPRLSDLRDSGAIEQDADMVLMLWRKEQPDFTKQSETISCKVAKHRNGPTGVCDLEFIKSTASFRG
jgi:replicative DNA helicase